MGSKMALSKSTRIKIMIAIDTAFFLLELICGFLAHSLALTADAFHMVRHVLLLMHACVSATNLPPLFLSSTTSFRSSSVFGPLSLPKRKPPTNLHLAYVQASLEPMVAPSFVSHANLS